VAGKLGCRGVVLAVRPGRLFYITDSVSSRRYLVDTGSAFSIMPWESTDIPSGPPLTAADGRLIPCWGERSCTVTIAGVARRWDFLLAGVSFPIIGIDFLRHHGLLMDVANLRLLPGSQPPAAVCAVVGTPGPAPSRSYAEVVRGTPPLPSGGFRVAAKGRVEVKVPSGSSAHTFAASSLQAATVAVSASSPSPPGSSTPSLVGPPAAALVPPPLADWAEALRLRFPAVFETSSAASSALPPHRVQHVITTIGQPCTAKFRRLDPPRLAAAKVEFQAMLDKGVIRRSSSQ
jgi:hypothetical protein